MVACDQSRSECRRQLMDRREKRRRNHGTQDVLNLFAARRIQELIDINHRVTFFEELSPYTLVREGRDLPDKPITILLGL